MELAGKYVDQVVAYPREVASGKYIDQHVVNEYTSKRYAQGDHLIWGGSNVGMFWASDVQDIKSLKPKPLEHAYQVVNQANKDLINTLGK
jgi:hypothetical protein